MMKLRTGYEISEPVESRLPGLAAHKEIPIE
jgi:hypothetical protein